MRDPACAIQVIRLNDRVAICCCCGAESPPPHWGIPIYEDVMLPNDWPEEWAGMDACEACWPRQGQLSAPVTRWAFRQQGTEARGIEREHCYVRAQTSSHHI